MTNYAVKFLVKPWLPILMVVAAFSISPVGAQTWEFTYIEGNKAGKVSACLALLEYTNAGFVVRLYDEEMDFIFRRDDFTLPFDENLGLVSFSFSDVDYVLRASTNVRSETNRLNTTDMLFLTANKEDYAGLFNALRRSSSLSVGFPNGVSYPVTLRGSSVALNAASRCWSTRATGLYENNPFGNNNSEGNPFVSPEAGNNPFDGT